jgi:hypothetical protein
MPVQLGFSAAGAFDAEALQLLREAFDEAPL